MPGPGGPAPKKSRTGLVIGLVGGLALIVVLALVITSFLRGGSGSGSAAIGTRFSTRTGASGDGKADATILGARWGTKNGRPQLTVAVELTQTGGKVGVNSAYCTTKSGGRQIDDTNIEPHFPKGMGIRPGETVRGLFQFTLSQQEPCEFALFYGGQDYAKVTIPAQDAGQPVQGVTSAGAPQKRVGEPFPFANERGSTPSATVTVTRLAWRGEGVLELEYAAVATDHPNFVTVGGFVAHAGTQQARFHSVDGEVPRLTAPGQRITGRLVAEIPRGPGRVELPTIHLPAAEIALPS